MITLQNGVRITSRLFAVAVFCFTLLLMGCSEKKTTPPVSNGPLTITEWKQLPPEIKFEEDGIRRLREGTPDLQNEAAFEKFKNTTFKQELKKDVPPPKPAGTY